jgi:tRNA-2-methylthio-N6-dimethylallyladenosine synthase
MIQEKLESKKLYIKTYGCQMNVYDSIKMQDLLKPHGFEISQDMPSADLVILNTCHIREKAAEKVYCELGRVKELKDMRKAKGEQMVVAVAGCVAQAEGEEIFARTPFVDIVVGPQSYHNLPGLLEQIKRKEKWAINLDFPKINKFDSLKTLSDSQGSSAFIAIQEGCDKFCHFCVVPYTRGAEYSRSVSEIYREALALAQNGTKEIYLLGQNVSAYHGMGPDSEVWSLGKLIKSIAKIDGIERIRYTTSHPRDMIDDDLFDTHATEEKLMPFLHLPIQSGSNKILDAMNRKHTREFYLQVIERFRKARSDISFSSDFIVGYPGETDEDFAETLRIVKEVEFSQCYSFKYSPRPGTPASALINQIPEQIKAARLLELQEVIKEYQQKFNKQFLGKTIKVLFDKEGKHNGQLLGRSEHMQAVFAEADKSCLDKICSVEVSSIEVNSLGAKLIKN